MQAAAGGPGGMSSDADAEAPAKTETAEVSETSEPSQTDISTPPLSKESSLDSKGSETFTDNEESTQPIEPQKPKVVKKSPQIKPFNLMNLKSPTYDSSNQLNKGFDPNHRFENYGHGLASKVKLAKDVRQPAQALRRKIQQRPNVRTTKVSQVVSTKKVSENAEASSEKAEASSEKAEASSDAKEEDVKASPQKAKPISIDAKSPKIKPFSLLSLKSPTYDSSNQLNKTFDGDHKVSNYARGSKSKVSVARKMMQKKIMQQPSAGKSNPRKFVLSEPSNGPDEGDIKEEEDLAEPVPPKLDTSKLTKPLKKPFSLKNLKSPTYDSSTLLNQAFDPNHNFEDYSHGVIEKVAVKKNTGMDVVELRKQITQRSATSPSTNSISSVDDSEEFGSAGDVTKIEPSLSS